MHLFSLMNITLQVIESSKSKIMSAIRIAKNGIDNQGFRIKNTKQQQSGNTTTNQNFENLQKTQFLVKM